MKSFVFESDLQGPAFRFQIWHLFYVLTFYSAGLGFSPGTIAATTIWLVVSFFALSQHQRGDGVKVFACALGVAFCFCCCMPNSVDVRGHARKTQCTNNLRQLGLAILNYESAIGNMPESRLLDSNGKPMHSWRVLILPYLQEETIFSQYSFAEPWDGPNNRKLHDQMPSVFRCPSRDHGNRTHYKIVRGEGTLFIDGVKPMLKNVFDGTSNTVLLVEDAGNPVNWLEPNDLTLEQAVKIFSNTKLADVPHVSNGLFEIRYFGLNVALMDGSVGHIGVDCGPDQLRKFFGCDNGVPDIEAFDREVTRVKYGAIVAVVMYFILGLLPLVWVLRKPRSRRLVKDDVG